MLVILPNWIMYEVAKWCWVGKKMTSVTTSFERVLYKDYAYISSALVRSISM